MKLYTLSALLFVCLSAAQSIAQFQIGTTTITFNDPSRSTTGFGSGGGPGRQIQCEIYYPAATAGTDVAVTNGSFPIIVFGHGFVMSWDAYENIWEHYVPQGYILAFPRTEGGVGVNHSEFAKDLLVVSNRMELEANDAASLFFNHWNGKKAVMGHSMGGGASFLAAGDVSSDFDAIVGMAPAETNPSAVTAAAGITIPTLVLSGTGDAVTPAADHHTPIYSAVPAAVCKQFIAITGGAHCYFANTNLACDFGESTSGGTISINRSEQHAILFHLLDPWLSFYLKGVCEDWTVFTDRLSTDNRIVGENDCTYQLPSTPTVTANGTQLSTAASGSLQWYFDGNALPGETGTSIETTTYGEGIYTVVITDENGCSEESDPFAIGAGASLSEIPNEIASIYPNPGSTQVVVEMYNSVAQQVTLTTILGQEIEKRTVSGSVKWDIEQLCAGMYYFRSENGSQTRFIKQ